jgi:hypothetical protein
VLPVSSSQQLKTLGKQYQYYQFSPAAIREMKAQNQFLRRISHVGLFAIAAFGVRSAWPTNIV